MLINLQTCTIPYFKGNFIITDLFLYHGWTTVASAAARDENVSLLFFVTPSIRTFPNHKPQKELQRKKNLGSAFNQINFR